MNDLWPFIISGLASGSIYGLAGVGLVLTYKTSGIFNFAHGAIAATAAFLFWEMHINHGWPWPVALTVSVLIVGGAGAALEPMTRSFIAATPKLAIVATVGLLLSVQGALGLLFGSVTRNVPHFLPTQAVELGGVRVDYAQMITMAGGATLAGVLYWFFRSSRLGGAMRAVVDDANLLSLTGSDPVQVRTWAWMISCGLAALSGVLIAPYLGLDAFLLTLLIVQAFGACAIGRFSSLPRTYAGGLIVGLAVSMATKLVADAPSLRGLPPAMPFLILFGVLLATPARRLASPARRADTFSRTERITVAPRITAIGGGVVVLILVLVPTLVGARLPLYTHALIFVLVFLSLGLLVNTSGQISLAHAGFAALGATTFSHVTVGAGLPWLPGLLLAGCATAVLGAMVAVPAIRVSGIYLALASFGLGILLEQVGYNSGLMFGSQGSRAANRPQFQFLVDLRTDRGFYFAVLAIVIVASVLVTIVLRSRLGGLLRALGDSPLALSTQGLSVTTTRVLVFCLSAFLAGIAGALFAASAGLVSPVGFGPFQSLMWLVVLAVAGTRVIPSAFLAAGLLMIPLAYLPDGFLEYQTLIFGTLALVVARLGLVDWRRRRRGRAARSPVGERRLRLSSGRPQTLVVAAVAGGQPR